MKAVSPRIGYLQAGSDEVKSVNHKHVLLVQAASPPPVQAASPSPVPGLIPLLSLLDLAPLLKLLRPCSVGQPLHRGPSTSSTLHLLKRPMPRARTSDAP